MYYNDPNMDEHYDDYSVVSSDKPHPEFEYNFPDDEEDYSIPESDITSNGRLKQRQIQMAAKMSDPGFFIAKRIVKIDGLINGKLVTEKRNVKIGYYHTPFIRGATIRNAVSGLFETDYKVGKKEEDLFFKVAMCTGEHGNSPHNLYYDSPEQCERHWRNKLDDAVKEKWNNKSARARELYAIEMEAKVKPRVVEIK